MKKVASPKCKGLRNTTFDEKIGNPKMQGDKKNTSDEKRGSLKMQVAKKKNSVEKGATVLHAFVEPKIKQDRQVIKTDFANLIVEGEGDTFWFGSHRTLILIPK
jgi:hypothetical protein